MYYVLGFKGSADLLSVHRNFPLSVESNSLRIAFQDCFSGLLFRIAFRLTVVDFFREFFTS